MTDRDDSRGGIDRPSGARLKLPAVAETAIASGLFYLFTYTLTSFGAWAVVIALEKAEGKGLEINDYAGLGRKYPALAAAMIAQLSASLRAKPCRTFSADLRVRVVERHPDFGRARIVDTPISEYAIVGSAVGAAMAGLRPVAEIMTINFAFLAMDQIVNHAAKLHYMFNGQIKVPLVIRTVGGGGRQLGATHSQTPDAIFAHFPGLKVVAPGTPADAR